VQCAKYTDLLVALSLVRAATIPDNNKKISVSCGNETRQVPIVTVKLSHLPLVILNKRKRTRISINPKHYR